jgi:cytochrome c2
MDSFEWNKIAGAVLFALLVAFGLSIFSELIFETEAPETPGYVVAIAEEGAAGGEADAPAEQPIGVLLAAADPAAGEGSARKCGACHTFNAGEANKVGPNLFDVVMRPIAGHEGYAYSDAMQAFAEQEESWDYEHLNTYLADPKGVVPGTKMAFAGLRDESERANVIAYLHTLSDDPAPLPPAEAAAPEADAGAEEGPAEAAAPATEGETEPAEAAAPAAEQEAVAEAPAAPAEAPSAPAVTPQPVEAATPADAPPAEQAAAPAPAPVAAEQPAAQPDAPVEQQMAQAEAPAAEPPAAAEAPAEAAAPAGAAAPAEAAAPASGFAALVAAADVGKGEAFARRCIACHTFEEGGANRVGPNLWGVVNRPVASIPDYAYSEAMVAYAEGGAKVWDYDTLGAYLEDPRAHVPGTKMVFPGIRSEEDRANVVAYLRSLAAEPAPLPAE